MAVTGSLLDRLTHLKSLCCEWLSSPSGHPLIYSPELPPHTHTHTRKHTHTHTHIFSFSSPITRSCTTTTVSLGHLCSLPTQGIWRVWWPKSLHCLPSLSPQQEAHHSPGVLWGWGLSEWHVCTAQRLQKRFKAADMLFCLLLCMSLLISSMDKWNVPPQTKATIANRERWGAGDEEQDDANLKMSAGVAFLIVYSHNFTHWCAWSCLRLFAYLNSAFCP